MKDYHKIDIALDTFPYTGVTTSFQSYLMGVPVLTPQRFQFQFPMRRKHKFKFRFRRIYSRKSR